MSSAYGSVLHKSNDIKHLMPMNQYKLKDGTPIFINSVKLNPSPWLFPILMQLLNEEIESGSSYPQEFPLSINEFEAYFLSSDAFVISLNPDLTMKQDILGMFYIKPNFPGRCSHICNGGFITNKLYRNKGVGTIMGKAFVILAKELGYKSSMFNLVFENNIASVKLWRKLEFVEIGRVPNAGRLTNSSKLVDAIMFYKDFK